MTFFKSSKHQRLLWSLLLLSVGAAAGFGLGIFCGAEPPVGCRESDLTPVPDESFVSPASASSVETSPEPEPMPEKWVCLDRKSTRLNSSHASKSRMPSSA